MAPGIILALQAQRPEFDLQNLPYKNWPWWCSLVSPAMGRLRQQIPGLLATQSSLLGEFQASDRPCYQGLTAPEEWQSRWSSGFHVYTHTCITTHTWTHTQEARYGRDANIPMKQQTFCNCWKCLQHLKVFSVELFLRIVKLKAIITAITYAWSSRFVQMVLWSSTPRHRKWPVNSVQHNRFWRSTTVTERATSNSPGFLLSRRAHSLPTSLQHGFIRLLFRSNTLFLQIL